MGLYGRIEVLFGKLGDIYGNAMTELGISPDWLDNGDKDISDLDAHCRVRCKQIIGDFFRRFTHFFISDNDAISIDSTDLRLFSMVTQKMNKEHSRYILCKITPNEFVESLERILVFNVLDRRSKSRSNISTETVSAEINEYMERLSDQYRKRILTYTYDDTSTESNELLVYSNFAILSCNLKKHHLMVDQYLAKRFDNAAESVSMNIHRCMTCGRKFIGKYTLSFYEEEFGRLDIRCLPDVRLDGAGTFDSLSSETELHRRGYRVSSGKMSEKQRRALLIELLVSGKMDYFEITRDIKSAINTQKHFPERAIHVEMWKSDLDFLRQYMDHKLSESE